MPKKGNKTARRTAGNTTTHAPQEKDDGSRWIVVRNGQQIYGGAGLVKSQAERLAQGLAEPAEIKPVERSPK